MTKKINYPLILLVLIIVFAALSYFGSYDQLTWWMEAFPIFIGIFLIWNYWKKFPLSQLLLTLIFIHSLILPNEHFFYFDNQ